MTPFKDDNVKNNREEDHRDVENNKILREDDDDDAPSSTEDGSSGSQDGSHDDSTSPPIQPCSSKDVLRRRLSLGMAKRKSIVSVVNPLSKGYKSREYQYVVCAGLALAFNSGYINGACLSGLLVESGRRQSVAGFTGAYTTSALSLADGDTDFFGFQVCMVLSFIVGATIAGSMTPNGKAWRIAPTYGPTFLVSGIILLIATLLAIVEIGNDKIIFYFAAAANGVQNGVSSMYSANLIRTCHLTGTSTDIGLLIGQYLRGNKSQVWKLRILIGLAVSFWCGGIVSFYATTHFTNMSLLFNSGLFFVIGVSLVVFLVKTLNVSVWDAVLGRWSWQEALEKLNLVTNDGKPVSPEEMMSAFDKIDLDGNGHIEEHELYNALEEAGLSGLSNRKVKAMMSVADKNSDGLLSREEWRELVMGKSSRLLTK